MVVIAELYSHIYPFSSLRKKEKLLKYFVLKSYIKWEENKTKKNEVKNNPWERSCNSEVAHIIVINGWETHRELEYEKKKNHVGHFSLQHLSVKLTVMYFG